MKYFLIILAAVILVFLLVPGYFGLFYKIEITEKNVGPFTILFEKHRGDYKETGAVMDRLYYSLLEEENIECNKGFGIYYDNPAEVEKSQLRCIAGNILEGIDDAKIEELKQKYTIKTFPETKAVYSEFPYKTNGKKGSGQMFFIMALMRTYPALHKYLEANKLDRAPVMEIYDVPAQKIRYITAVNLDKKVFEDYLE